VSELRALQARFWRHLVHPTGVAAQRDLEGAALHGWLAYDDEDVAVERLDVYANMYFFRIRDILAEDFAAVSATLGPERFHNLATDYLLACPPEDPNIRNVGARLPTFLAGHDANTAHPHLAELARFEWARLDVFDRADEAPLSAEALAALSPEGWANLELQTISALALERYDHRVHDAWAAAKAGHPKDPDPTPTTLVVWRKGFRVFHRPVGGAEEAALAAAREGECFASLCEIFVGPEGDINAAAKAAHGALLRWLEEGLIRGAAGEERRR